MTPNISDHVDITGSGNTRTVKCKYCINPIKSNNKDRWEQHIRTCERTSAEVKNMFPTRTKKLGKTVYVEERGSSSSSIFSKSVEPNDSISVVNESTSCAKRVKLERWIDQISTADKTRLDNAYANIFFKTAIPFRFADAKSVKDFFAIIRPSWKPPSSKRIRTTLLDENYENVQGHLREKLLEAKRISIVTDGWSNVNGMHLVNFVLIFDRGEVIYFKTINTGEEEQSGKNIANSILNVIYEIGVENVVSVVTDNASNMQAAWRILEAEVPGLICNGCAAHTFNLLVKDICQLEMHKDTLLKCREITAFVKQRTAVLCRFKAIQKSLIDYRELSSAVGLVYVAETRWYTHHACVKRILENKKVLVQLCDATVVTRIDGKSKQRRIDFVNTIKNEQFWLDVKSIEKILKPTSEIVGIFESNSSTLSNVYSCFKRLMDEWKNDKVLSNILMTRWNFIHTASMGISYLLDPKTKCGFDMVGEDKLDTLEQLKTFIKDKKIANDDRVIQNELEMFIDFVMEPSAEMQIFIDSNSCKTFWMLIGSSKFPLLYQVSLLVFNVPTSQAASERIWSLFDFIHSKRRNRLSPEKADKLVSLYANSSLMDNDINMIDIMAGAATDAEEETDEE